MTETTTQLSEQDIDAMEARANAATEGPWEWRDDSPNCLGTQGNFNDLVCEDGADSFVGLTGSDLRFTAHARTDIPDLIREWRTLQEQINKFRQQFELLDDPQGLYSATKSEVENSAATRMRDKCVEKIRGLLEREVNGHSRGAYQRAIVELQSLTLDNGETDARSNS